MTLPSTPTMIGLTVTVILRQGAMVAKQRIKTKEKRCIIYKLSEVETFQNQ